MGYFDHTVAFKITHNEGNYTRGGLRVPSPRDQAERPPECKDAHRKPPLPHFTGH